jgi:hypothetical protein
MQHENQEHEGVANNISTTKDRRIRMRRRGGEQILTEK